MTEMDQLKREAEKQYAKQRMDELHAYLEKLIDRIAKTGKLEARSWLVFTLGWVTWVVSDFFNASSLGMLAYIIALGYNNYRVQQASRARAEFHGAVEVLRILGMLDLPDEGEKKRKRSWSEGAEIVKGWAKEKKTAQEGVYAPA